MLRTRQYSLGYLLVEIALIALSIHLGLHLYRTRNVMWPRTWWWALPSAVILISAAVGGLFGRMRTGALAGVGVIALYLVYASFPFFPQVY